MCPPSEPAGAARRRRGRISRSGDFDRVYRQGRATGGRSFVVHVFPRDASLEPPRVGLSVSKKVGDAVTRNRIKRVVRASLDALAPSLAAGASGYLLKRLSPRQLLEAIDEVCDGGSPMSASIARKVVQSFKVAPVQGEAWGLSYCDGFTGPNYGALGAWNYFPTANVRCVR